MSWVYIMKTLFYFQQSLIWFNITGIKHCKPNYSWIQQVRLTQESTPTKSLLHYLFLFLSIKNESHLIRFYIIFLLLFPETICIYTWCPEYKSPWITERRNRNGMQKEKLRKKRLLSSKSSLARTISNLQSLIDEISGLLTTDLDPDAAAFIHFYVWFLFLLL